jgi:CDP-diacylglycerol---serine O-phosphatidyltransferase
LQVKVYSQLNRMEEKNPFKLVASKKSRFILPNLLTLIGVCLGISSIKFALDQNYNLAVIFLIFAAILDTLDGRIARLIKGTSEFGKELDSLTDFVSFGIAPAFILYFWELKNYGKIGWAITLIFSVCCVLRLARFNLTKISEDAEWKRNYFEGIPSPAGAIIILLPLIYELSELQLNLDIKKFTPYLVVVVAILLISSIPTFSLKKIKTSSQLTIFLLFGIVVTFVSLIFFTFKALLVLCLLYLLSIPVSYFLYKRTNKKLSKISKGVDHEDIL